MEKEELIDNLKAQIIRQLNLDIDPDFINGDSPIFKDSGLGLDSIDDLELVALLGRNYDIKVRYSEDIQEKFKTLNSLADYIIKESTVQT
jgi:acyl carrier protein